MDDNNVDERIGDSLKHVGNMKKMEISKLHLTNVLGPEGVNKSKDVKTNRVKILAREKRKIEQVHTAVEYFDLRMEKRIEFLVRNTKRLLGQMYILRDYAWKGEHHLIMNNRNRKRGRKISTK